MGYLDDQAFITDSLFKLPRAGIGRPGEREVWDILRPNRKAIELVSTHMEALQAFNIMQKPGVAVY